MTLSCDVIIPVKDGEPYLADCLASVMGQLREGDSVTVVDDGSLDATAAIAHALIFFDMRCRAQPGWLDEHRRLLSRTGVALSASGVSVLSGPTLGERIAHLQQPYRLAAYVDTARRPYFATCNLGVRRQA